MHANLMPNKLTNITLTVYFHCGKIMKLFSCSQERLTLEMFALLSFQSGNLNLMSLFANKIFAPPAPHHSCLETTVNPAK